MLSELLNLARLAGFTLLIITPSAHGFSHPSSEFSQSSLCFQHHALHNKRELLLISKYRKETDLCSRRNFVSAAFLLIPITTAQSASAGIDVSGLRTDGGGGNPTLKEQLKAYDGSAASRANQLKEITSSTASSQPSFVPGNNRPSPAVEEQGTIASWAYRAAPGLTPRLTRTGPLGNLFHCDDQVVAPSNQQQRSLSISFEFPSDWLQLDKFLGGITYVDQRNGDRLYVLRTKLPDGERLATINKKFMGSSLFDPQGVIVKSQGVEVDEYKVTSSKVLTECPNDMCATRRRFQIKYYTVTGNGLRVERRALVDAYEVTPTGDVYMMMTSTNAVKFEAGGIERETAEAIVNSFRINI
ncbi:hypothetical protein FisN_1Lh051 [Fistulifera solaris]|uniref:PsbP C-terminal domain-containing protein n=1 Tax=Fistulifera solaris TaxID=1519565 RepID=A0A1Z5JCA9_FISSO|nr:hypothetical protein FisN_1Lh051 [Fistulifera solaris]|eukprot:GAX11586.1 hypothetical protein FisN_1Lh051 [Fistulifera solaris]